MSTIILRLVLLFGILLLIDFYAFQAVKSAFRNQIWSNYGYWIFAVLVFCYMFYIVITFGSGAGSTKAISLFMGVVVLTYVPKLFVVAFLFSEDIVRFFICIAAWLSDVLKLGSKAEDTGFFADRRAFVSQLGLAAAAIPFAGIIYGIIRGKYNYQVMRQTLYFDDLPDAFDGFTIAQLSDIHCGSFTDAEKIEYGIQLANDQNPDLLLFTGDLVNNKAEEMLPWIETFKKLKAKYGKYSVLGNHDYGDYVAWPNLEAKAQNMRDIEEVHRKLGFKLMKNESQRLEKDGQFIQIIGIENWGNPPFPQHGDLSLATAQVAPQDFKILMSHDPSHFDAQVKDFKKKIHLTFSGHTHGMQFGIEVPGIIKWSPVKYRYPKWAGLYEEFGRYLYVNRGFGYLAFPGRVGIWPEITIIELKKTKV